MYRAFRLASAKDAWVGSGFQDSSGRSGKSLGRHFDARIRWRVSRYFVLESGFSRFFKGSYLYLVPDSPETGDSNHFYIATEINAKLLPY
jgi:hypothetical protein